MDKIWEEMKKEDIEIRENYIKKMCSLLDYIVWLFLGNLDIEYHIRLVNDLSESICHIKTNRQNKFICILCLSIEPYTEYNIMQSKIKRYNEYFKSIHIPEHLYKYASILFVWLHEIGHARSYYEVYRINGIAGVKSLVEVDKYIRQLLPSIYTNNQYRNTEYNIQYVYSKSYVEMQADIFVYRNFASTWELIKDNL